MAFAINRGARPRAQRIVVYGVEGIGKSTFAASFPDAVFIDTEGSTDHLDVARFEPAPTSWQQILDMVAQAGDSMPAGSTLVVDTLDWAERMCVDAVCAENRWNSIESPGYGKGYKVAMERFAKLLDALTDVAGKGVNVVCTAHAKIVKFEQPDEAGAYDRWGMKLIDTRNTSIASMVKEWADAVLFANYKTIVERTEDGKAKARGNRRVMYTCHDAVWDAKNRWGLPPEVPFEFASIAAHVPAVGRETSQNQISGPSQAAPEQTPSQAAAAPQASAQAPDAGQFGSLGKLFALMRTSGVADGELRMAVASQGYATMQQPIESYRPELLDYLVAKFDAVRGVVEEQRKTPIL